MHRRSLLLIFGVLIAGSSIRVLACDEATTQEIVAAPSTSAGAKHESPFACDRLALTPAERKRHFDELGPALLKVKNGVHELSNGYEFRFPSDRKTFAMLSEWIDQERLCCPFFDLSLRFEPEGGPLWLRVTGRPGTKDFISKDAAKWVQR